MIKYLTHDQWMERAVTLSLSKRYRSFDRPWIGAVIVKGQRVVAEGFTTETTHAETEALKRAGIQARGATLYVTLEPCSHHGRTPPCCDAVIAAGISEIYIGLADPNPEVNREGIRRMEAAGIKVKTGICEEKVKGALAPYLHVRETGRAYCFAKAACSIDGRIAASDGSSQWLTNAEARIDVHRLRAESQAIVVGSETALRDRPQLTVRHPAMVMKKRPLRVIVDSRGRVMPGNSPLFDTKLGETVILTTREKYCEEAVQLPADREGRVDLSEMLRYLAKREVIQAFVEGGSGLHSGLLKEGLIDRMAVYYGNQVIGDGGLPLFSGLEIGTLNHAKRFQMVGMERFGDCHRVDFLNQRRD